MKTYTILVVSDSHGDTLSLQNVISRHVHEIDCIVHAGDFARDIESCDTSGKKVYSVPGNMDGVMRDDSLERIENISNQKVLITHSDHLASHFGLDRLFLRSQELEADLCIFGHTHTPYVSQHKPYLINPGSLGTRATGNGTYGLIRIDGQVVTCSILEL